MRRRKLLFATYNTGGLEGAFSYAVDLAGTLGKDLCVLLVNEKSVSEKFDDLMAAVSFAEESTQAAAREMMAEEYARADATKDKELVLIMNKCRMAGVELEVYTAHMKIVPAINGFIKRDPGVDMVLLGPTVTDARAVSARELKKLVSSVSKPVVTMAKHGFAT